MLSGNKGEWSEVYTLLKIIADKQLYRGDGNLNRLENSALPIIKVLREESNGTYEYEIRRDIVIISGEDKEVRISVADFQKRATDLLNRIQLSSGSFEIPEIENFMASFNCRSLKAGSNVKSDILIVLHDTRTGMSPELGFSIKSQLGNPSTLLNAGMTTNFIYEIIGERLPPERIQEINSIDGGSKVKDRLDKIAHLNRSLRFDRLEKPIFSNNLTIIDSALPAILAEIVYLFYTSEYTNLTDLVNEVAFRNPLNFDTSTLHPFYIYKIKRLLTDIALGMMPSKVWTGKLDATGGYLIVKEDGDVLSYHIYNRNEFEEYLFNHTKLETASTSRHKFGEIYEEYGLQFFKLNLQIRFIK